MNKRKRIAATASSDNKGIKLDSDIHPEEIKLQEELQELATSNASAQVKEDITWWKKQIRQKIAKSVLSNVNLTEHHINSFNDLCSTWLQKIILTLGNMKTVHLTSQYEIRLSNFKFVRGEVRPSEAHMFNISYCAHIYVDMHEYILTSEQKHIDMIDNKRGDVNERDNPAPYPASGDEKYPWIKRDFINKDCHLCDFPIMLNSKACYLSTGADLKDQTEPQWGGGLISRGKRRCIPMLKTLANNIPYLFHNKNKRYSFVQVRSEHLGRQHRSTSSLELWIDDAKSNIATMFYNVMVKIPFLNTTIPVPIILLALGCPFEQFIDVIDQRFIPHWNTIERYKKYIIALQNDFRGCTDQVSALGYINKLQGRPELAGTATHTLRNEVLPHLNGLPDVEFAKAHYLAYIYALLIRFVEGDLPETDRDAYAFTRLTDSGTSLAVLFRKEFILFMTQGVKILRCELIQNKKIAVSKIYNPLRLTKKIITAVANGVWSRKRKGISHAMTTNNKDAVISQLRRISSSYLNNEGKHMVPRMVKGDGLGYACAAETPEGASCGLVYSLALTSRVTRSSDGDALVQILIESFHDNFIPWNSWKGVMDPDYNNQYYTFFDAHGRPIGYLRDVDQAVKQFIHLRRTLAIDYLATYYKNVKLREFRVMCELGRVVRPLLILENLYKVPEIVRRSVTSHQSSLMRELLIAGCLEYVSATEEKTLRITFCFADVFKPGSLYTHLEISDVSFIGVVGALAPLFRHNQGPRLVYWIGMSKQIIGCSPEVDMGTSTTHNLWYGQKPAVPTATACMLNMDQLATCVNCTVIFYTLPYNQEDAIVMNQASIDKGMFTSSCLRTYETSRQGSKNESTGEIFENPLLPGHAPMNENRSITTTREYREISSSIPMDPIVKTPRHPPPLPSPAGLIGRKVGSHAPLRRDGLTRPNTQVEGGDCVIGKTVPSKKTFDNSSTNERKRKRCDKSVQIRTGERGTVAEVILVQKENSHIAKVRVKSVQKPQMGDKFASRHSQKGVMGRAESPENLPFCMKTGMIPDVVMTPQGFPSRMTMGKLLEMLLGKAACVSGNVMDGIDDQFFDEPGEVQMVKVRDILRKHGYKSDGTQVFADGITGEPIEAEVMCGVVSYVKLNHMVSQKHHARATGPIHNLTRQPPSGRRNTGGLKCGGMELECIMAHAGTEILRERTLTTSDEFTVYACSKCGNIGDGNKNIGLFFCRVCKTGQHMRTVDIPYTTKLLMQEQNATGVKMTWELE